MRMLSRKRQRERRLHHKLRPRARCGSITCMSETKKGNFQRRKRLRDHVPQLPEDIWCHIHSLMPMQDSARAACVSRMFLRSWRHYPNLILTKETLGFERNTRGKGDIKAFTNKVYPIPIPMPLGFNIAAFTNIVNQIMKNHLGAAIKTLELDISYCLNLDPCFLNNWLQIGITPGTENVTLRLPIKYKEEYNFPCSLLSGGNGSSIRYLHLTYCALRPTHHLGCLRSLTKLYLHGVRITGDELGCLLSLSLGLTELELVDCSEIICLNITCVLEQLSCLTVFECSLLQMIESKAPNLSAIHFEGDLVQLSLGQPLQVKSLEMDCSTECNFLSYAITKLPYTVPNVGTLTLSSVSEMVDTPMVAAKFLHLKYLDICLDGDQSPGYDYLSLVSFFDASPVLETFILRVHQFANNFDSVFDDGTHMRQVPVHKHHSLKNVKIFGFCSAKSMVQLTRHILENATALGCITLDTVFDENDEDDTGRCCVNSTREAGVCCRLSNVMILEGHLGLQAIKKYIVGKVTSDIELDVRGPCSQCHNLDEFY